MQRPVCHGGVKGQGGLKLSANALTRRTTTSGSSKGGAYQVLTAEVKGERIPRIDLAKPEKSLLLAEADDDDSARRRQAVRSRTPTTTARSSIGSGRGALRRRRTARSQNSSASKSIRHDAMPVGGASPAGHRPLQRRTHGRLHPRRDLCIQRRRDRRRQRRRGGQRKAPRRDRDPGPRGAGRSRASASASSARR